MKTDYQKTLEGVLYTASKNFGFLDSADVAVIAGADRLRQLLVRCGGCRLTCAAQDFAHLSACIVAGGDYVRDVSLPATDKAMVNPPRPTELVILAPATATTKAEIGERYVESPQPRCDCGQVASVSHACHFHEEDCGGVFDGNTVTSDADPGL